MLGEPFRIDPLCFISSQGAGTGYHPANLHPIPEKQGKPTEGGTALGASEAQKKVAGPDEQNTDVDKTTGRDGVSEKAHETAKGDEKKGHHEKTKKVGFMEKMKGEAKMLLGKVEGGKKGENKVEEGRKIKTGEGHSPSSANA